MLRYELDLSGLDYSALVDCFEISKEPKVSMSSKYFLDNLVSDSFWKGDSIYMEVFKMVYLVPILFPLSGKRWQQLINSNV
jgi:hypothetical protein